MDFSSYVNIQNFTSLKKKKKIKTLPFNIYNGRENFMTFPSKQGKKCLTRRH